MPFDLLLAILLAAQGADAAPDATAPQEITDPSEMSRAQAAPATPADEAESEAEDDPDRMICRRPEPVLGSRVRMRRTCMTAAQWRVYREGRDAWRRDYQNRSDPLAYE